MRPPVFLAAWRACGYHKDRMKEQLAKLGILFAGWSLMAAFLAASRSLYRVTLGRPGDFLHLLRLDLIDYWIWVALTPAIFYLAKRFQFTRTTWARSTAIHFCGYLGAAVAHETIAQLLGLPFSAPAGFSGSLLKLRIVDSLYDDLWMYWPIVVIWSLFEYYQRFRERDLRATRLSEQLARSELQGLRNQIRPHFLFNTLNSIAALIHRDVEAADDMLADLGYLLRAYLTGDEEQESALGRELQLLGTYVRIQQRRFQDRLSWSTDVAQYLLDAVVPTLLLQPLVENAILHGIASRSEPGHVHIAAHRAESSLMIEVTDDGSGLAPNFKEGLGLSNTRSRLLQLYGDKQSFNIQSKEGQGVTIRVTLPLRFVTPQDVVADGDTGHERERQTADAVSDSVATAPASLASNN